MLLGLCWSSSCVRRGQHAAFAARPRAWRETRCIPETVAPRAPTKNTLRYQQQSNLEWYQSDAQPPHLETTGARPIE